MFTCTSDRLLPTTIIGSLPRPHWYTANLGNRTFLEAMADGRFREQYTDAVSSYLRDQEIAGLDICTDGDARFDTDVGGRVGTLSGEAYGRICPTLESRYFEWEKRTRGTILSEVSEFRILPEIVSAVGPGDLQYTAVWRAAQRLTTRPVKFGTIAADLLALMALDKYYKDIRDRIMAVSGALNSELLRLARAGCPAIQIEDPQVHMLAAKDIKDSVLTPSFQSRD